MNWNLGCYSTGHQSTASTENFTHPDDEFDQYWLSIDCAGFFWRTINVQKFSTKWMLARRTVRASFLNEKQLLEWKEQNITFMVKWNNCQCYCYCCRFCRLFCYHGCVLVVVTAVPDVSAVIFLVLILLFFRYGYCGCKTFSSLVFLALRLNLNMHCLIWNVKRSCLLKTSHHLTLWILFFASR